MPILPFYFCPHYNEYSLKKIQIMIKQQGIQQCRKTVCKKQYLKSIERTVSAYTSRHLFVFLSVTMTDFLTVSSLIHIHILVFMCVYLLSI